MVDRISGNDCIRLERLNSSEGRASCGRSCMRKKARNSSRPVTAASAHRASANQWTSLFSGFAADQKANLASKAGYISQADAQKVAAAVIAACDAADGVKDWYIQCGNAGHPEGIAIVDPIDPEPKDCAKVISGSTVAGLGKAADGG